MEVSDVNILTIYKKNKRQGLELIYDRYKKYVYTLAYNYSASREDALDITQEVFISVFKTVDGFKEGFSMLPWIKKITVNRCLNFIRDRKASTSLHKSDGEGMEIISMIPSGDKTESRVIFKDSKEILERAIKSLPDSERMAVILRHVKNMKYDDIARTMALPLGTVKTLLYRGRKILKEKLEADNFWED